MAKKLPPIHPGEILREEFLVPLKLTPYAVAAALNVPRTRIERIAREEKPVTADTALRLGRRCARAADQEDRVLRGGVRAMQIARTEYLITDSLITQRDVESLA